MSTASVGRSVAALVGPSITAAGFDLEDVEVTRAGRRSVVRITVDGESGISLDDIATVSRVVSDALDAADVIPGEYVLEVSSRGTDRPLTEVRHWRRNVGRLVAVTRHQAKSVTGRVVSVDDASVTLDAAGKEVVVPLSDVLRALVQVEFRHHGAAPGAPDDLDDIDDETDDDKDEEVPR